MDVASYVSALRRDGAALAGAAEGNLEREVASCPGWTIAELVWHTGEVHHFWAQVAERRLQDRKAAREVDRPADTALVPWFAQGVGHLASVLESADPSEPVWTWSSQKNIGFIQRRMAQETAVHRWDAEAARGAPGAIDPELAVDGIDEFLDFFLPDAREGAEDARGSVHLHSTDAAGEWMVAMREAAVNVQRGHAKADVAVRAPASDLLLLLWRRIAPSAVEVIGDRTMLERFLARTDLD